MTEQQLPTPGAPEPTPEPTPEPDVKPKTKSKDTGTGSGRFAVYNETLTQYVGPVVDKKPTQAEASKLVPKGHKATVREV